MLYFHYVNELECLANDVLAARILCSIPLLNCYHIPGDSFCIPQFTDRTFICPRLTHPHGLTVTPFCVEELTNRELVRTIPSDTHPTYDMNYLRQPYNDDSANQPWSQRCTCGKCFMQPNSYALHVGCCSHFKARLGKNLKLARERRGLGSSEPDAEPNRAWKRKLAWIDDENLDVDYGSPLCRSELDPEVSPTILNYCDMRV